MDKQHAIINVCKKRGFTIVSLSKRSGINRDLLSDYCRFKIKDSDLDNRLMSFLNLTEEDIKAVQLESNPEEPNIEIPRVLEDILLLASMYYPQA